MIFENRSAGERTPVEVSTGIVSACPDCLSQVGSARVQTAITSLAKGRRRHDNHVPWVMVMTLYFVALSAEMSSSSLYQQESSSKYLRRDTSNFRSEVRDVCSVSLEAGISVSISATTCFLVRIRVRVRVLYSCARLRLVTQNSPVRKGFTKVTSIEHQSIVAPFQQVRTYSVPSHRTTSGNEERLIALFLGVQDLSEEL